jgi:hypothetical protein
MARLLRFLILALAALLAHAPAEGAALALRIAEVDEGWVHFAYPARPGVSDNDEEYIIRDGEVVVNAGAGDGLVHVALERGRGEVERLRLRVGRLPRRLGRHITDLGEVAARDAVDYLLPLAREASEDIAEDAVTAVALADVETWQPLLAIARDHRRPKDVRQGAIFWVSQQAGDKVAGALETMVADTDEEIELREHAIFALSECLDEDAVAVLGRIARESDHPDLRRQALFWLAQRDDPAVLDFFEGILLE